MTEFELLIDLHKDGSRQGPGSPEVTKKAFDLTGIEKSDSPRIADIGCGTGAQTLTLAQYTGGHITAVDLFPEFLERLDRNAEELGLQDRITTMTKSMDALPFAEAEFDLIWSEGAIYIMGFEEGVKSWKRFLKPGGYLAVSEVSWITGSRPKEIEDYWRQEYPHIDTISNKISVLEQHGYSPVAHFVLPEYCWLDNYYRPNQERFEAFLERHRYSAAARELVEAEQQEIEMYERYKAFYSYGFYIAEKR